MLNPFMVTMPKATSPLPTNPSGLLMMGYMQGLLMSELTCCW